MELAEGRRLHTGELLSRHLNNGGGLYAGPSPSCPASRSALWTRYIGRSILKSAEGMEPSQQVYDAGQEVASASAPTLAEVLNRALGRFVGWPFTAAPGYVVDQDGTRTEAFTSVVYTPSTGAILTAREGIPADTVAAVIDARENIDLEQFREAYRRTAQAKTLKKGPAPDLGAVPNSTITLGIIFALQSGAPLEILAEELDRLNANTPSRQWPDMVAVASTGTLNYAVQFPGQEVSGDFLPPAEGALAAYTPPMYIIIVMRPTGAYTFNKMMSFLIAHLAIFSPGANLPNFAQIQQGVPKHAVVISGYQYDLSGRLLPVPRHLYNDRYIAPLPIRIEDRQGNLLSTLQFVPWQDGGIVLPQRHTAAGPLARSPRQRGPAGEHRHPAWSPDFQCPAYHAGPFQ